jgi:transforming growth factor-beta-induced protein
MFEVSSKKRKSSLLIVVLMFILGIGFWTVPQPAAASPTVQEDAEQEDAEDDAQQNDSQESSQSVWDVIKGNEQLSDFVTLARAAGLADNLDHDGPFTVFVPTNQALADLETILSRSGITHTQLLLYHIANGQYGSAAVADRSALVTLMGEPLQISVENGEVILNGSAAVTTADLSGDNGVVHIIDSILLPPENSLGVSTRGSSSDSLLQVLEDDGRFTTFLSLAQQAGFADDLSQLNNTFTIFAPTNTAFDNLTQDQIDEYTKDEDTLNAILLYHLVGDRLGINQIATDDYIPTREGRPLFVTYDEDNQTVMINGQPLADFNIVAGNGVIHAVDTILTPP